MINIKPKDIIACIVLLGVFVLKAVGKDGQVDIAGSLILGYYFAHRADGNDKGI
jgi:hypothetical protein